MSAFVSVWALFEGDQVRHRREGQGARSQARVRHWLQTETSKSMSGSTRGARARRTTTCSCVLVLPQVACLFTNTLFIREMGVLSNHRERQGEPPLPLWPALALVVNLTVPLKFASPRSEALLGLPGLMSLPGYHLWVASFAVLLLAALMERQRTSSDWRNRRYCTFGKASLTVLFAQFMDWPLVQVQRLSWSPPPSRKRVITSRRCLTFKRICYTCSIASSSLSLTTRNSFPPDE